MFRFILCFVLFSAFFLAPIHATEYIATNADTIIKHRTLIQSKYFRQSIVPVALAGSSLAIMAIPDLKYKIQERLNWDKEEHVILYDDVLRYAPIGVGAILSICGVKSRHPILHQVGLIGVSYVVADFIVYRTKIATKVQRPDSQGENSFPSQHASMAFVAATVLHREMGDVSPWISVGGYATAAWVGYARVARNRHYVSDVLMGAAIGTLVTNMTYWAYDAISTRFTKNLTITPQISSGFVEMQLSYNF